MAALALVSCCSFLAAFPVPPSPPTAATTMQLVLLKNALLLGVGLSYGTTLVGVQAPEAKNNFSKASWHVWAKGGVSSHDFKHVPLSAADLAAADLAADEADELERVNIDVISSAMVDLPAPTRAHPPGCPASTTTNPLSSRLPPRPGSPPIRRSFSPCAGTCS